MASTFVLVHGGWHGGWCWREVASRLRQDGHDVHCPTMTGLAERSHLIDAVEGPDTHVDDIANVIRWNELNDIILVGHSYGGLIVTGVATRMPEKTQHLVYLDAFVPTADNQSPADLSILSRSAEIAKAAVGHKHVPPSGFERWSSSPENLDWLKRMTTPHPRSCFGAGVSRVDDPSAGPFKRTYIACAKHDPSPFLSFYQRYKDDPRWHCVSMDCLHDAMVDQPAELADLLLEAANR
ncbi:MAG: alpha/beta fold hydrolase [Pseudomonadota bacterium]